MTIQIEKIPFENGNVTYPINDTNLNKMQDNFQKGLTDLENLFTDKILTTKELILDNSTEKNQYNLTLLKSANDFDKIQIEWINHKEQTCITEHLVKDLIKVSNQIGLKATESIYQQCFREYDIAGINAIYIAGGFINIASNGNPTIYLPTGSEVQSTYLIINKIYGIKESSISELLT